MRTPIYTKMLDYRLKFTLLSQRWAFKFRAEKLQTCPLEEG